MNEISHSLSDRDTAAMTATCAVCGPVRLKTRGRGRFVCGVRAAERHAEWAARNPEKARRNRRGRSAHHLTSFDESTLTGECPVCGIVGVVPKGRGFMCRTRAEEIWTQQQSSPQQRCGVCRRVWLSADGTCAYCSDREAHDWSLGLKTDQDLADLKQLAHDWAEDIKPLETIVDEKTHSAYAMPRSESAEPR